MRIATRPGYDSLGICWGCAQDVFPQQVDRARETQERVKFSDVLQDVGNVVKQPGFRARQSFLLVLEVAVVLARKASCNQYNFVRML